MTSAHEGLDASALSWKAIHFSFYAILAGHEHTSPGRGPALIPSEAIAVVFLFGHAGLTLLGKGSWSFLLKREALWNRPREVFWVAAFSLLPDLVDKPLSLWLWPDPPSTRLTGHTLAFWIIFWGGLQILAPRIARWTWVPLLHLFLDQMWESPHTLLFPFLGWQMDPGFSQDLSFWELLRWNIYLYSSQWALLIPELVGLAYLAYLGVRLGLRTQAGRIGARITQPRSRTPLP